VSETVNWSRMSLEELQHHWNAYIEVDLEQAGYDLETRPTYRDLLDVGAGGIQYTLREHHDMTLSEFLETVGYHETSDESYPWGIEDETTIDELESYALTLERRQNLAGTTIASKKARLTTFVQLYRDIHGQANIVDRAADTANESAEIQRLLVIFDELNDELGTDGSKIRYRSDVNQFYEHLERRAKAAFNPAANIHKEYNWSRDEADNRPLTTQQVREMYAAVEDPSEQLLILALCAWGLRRSEVASLHVSQLVLEGDDPRIHFDNRKNGPGTVALIYGIETLADRIDELGTRDRRWNGYLFPSTAASSGHITGETVQARFQRVAKRAGVRVDGEVPTSKMGRRYWYTTYLESQKQLLENLDVIAADQGSSDSSVVLNNYLSEEERRNYRRAFMRDQLATAFE